MLVGCTRSAVPYNDGCRKCRSAVAGNLRQKSSLHTPSGLVQVNQDAWFTLPTERWTCSGAESFEYRYDERLY